MVGVAPDSDPHSLFSVKCSFKFFVSSDWSTGRVRPQSLNLGLMIDGSAWFIFSHTSVLWSLRGECVCVCACVCVCMCVRVTFLVGWVWLREGGGSAAFQLLRLSHTPGSPGSGVCESEQVSLHQINTNTTNREI